MFMQQRSILQVILFQRQKCKFHSNIFIKHDKLQLGLFLLDFQIPTGCPTPTCNVDYEITDAWGKHGAHNTQSRNQPIKFGYVFKIKVPAEYWTRKGFSIMIRWRDIQSASFQLWNANFFNIYRKKGGIDVLIHSRPYDQDWDRAGVHEFVFVADRLAVNSLRK